MVCINYVWYEYGRLRDEDDWRIELKMQLKCGLHDHHVCVRKCIASAKQHWHTQFFYYEFEKTVKNIFL